MNAICIDSNGSFKLCPYRVITEEHRAIGWGDRDSVTQMFYPCVGEDCIAYHDGICLRAREALKEVK